MIIRGIITLVIFIAGVVNIRAQSPVEIKGAFSAGKGTRIRLLQTDEGSTSEIAQIKVKDDGTFRFAFFPEYEGLYVLRTGNSEMSSSDRIFYFKGGDRLELALTPDDYVLQGAGNSKENQILSKWDKASEALREKTAERQVKSAVVDFNSFFVALDQLTKESKRFLTESKSGNRQFDQLLPQFVRWDMAYLTASFLNKSEDIKDAKARYSSALNGYKAVDYTQSAQVAHRFPFGNQTLKFLVQNELKVSEKSASEGINELEKGLRFIQNDTLKGDQVLDYLSMQKSYRPFTEATNKYGSYFLTKRQKQLFDVYKLKFDEFTPGDMGFQFSYPDKNGKLVKLSDFKGKVVVVDVWATWCGPCLKEVPYLRKLEESLKGKDVVFIGMSTDADKDKAKWKEMIEQEEMKGSIHILAGQSNEFSKFYKIGSIPRFLVFDKKGNLVTANAPRPSNPDLRSIVEEELKY